MDYTSLIWRTNMAIMEAIAYNNTGSIPELVEYLETILSPYIDKICKTELNRIRDIKPKSGNTQNAIKNNILTLNNQKVTLTHRALLQLAYRKKFLPATGSHQADNDFILGGPDE